MTENQTRIYMRTIALINRFTKRLSKLPEDLQETFLSDLETAIENRLRVLERAKE
jgi:hypothetical protein